MDIVWILVLLALALVLGSLRIVEQNTVAVVEFLGKYRRTMGAGLNILIPLLEQIRERVTLRQQNFALSGHYPSKDKVIVTVGTIKRVHLVYKKDAGIKYINNASRKRLIFESFHGKKINPIRKRIY
jgi:regulator of protease activity HflC (stomatin/prohibitin superfamily)